MLKGRQYIGSDKCGLFEAVIDSINEHVDQARYERQGFAVRTIAIWRRGDSGGPVLDMENKLVGLVLGGTDGSPTVLEGHERLGAVWCSYIRPIQLILDRIELVTGIRLEPILVDLDERKRNGEEIVL
jgi:hypothetical protein